MTDTTPVQGATPSPAQRASSRRAVRNAAVALGLLLAGSGVVRGLERWMNATFDKPPAPLARPLTEVSRRLGSPVRYVADKPDEVLDPETVEALGTHDYLVREYHDTQAKADAPGEFLNLNVNYYAHGSSSPHVPEVCWAGNGRREAPGSGEIFEIPNVPRKYGPPVTLRAKLVSFLPTKPGTTQAEELPPGPDGEPVYTNVAYVFQVNGEYVSNTQEVSSHFWKASNLYAYHCKIEVTPMVQVDTPSGRRVVPALCSRAQARRMVSQFMTEALGEVEACLPDPAILTPPATPAAPAGSPDAKTR
jgi:hypothetical protein